MHHRRKHAQVYANACKPCKCRESLCTFVEDDAATLADPTYPDEGALHPRKDKNKQHKEKEKEDGEEKEHDDEDKEEEEDHFEDDEEGDEEDAEEDLPPDSPKDRGRQQRTFAESF